MAQNARLEQEILLLHDSLHAYRFRHISGLEFLSKRDSATLAALGVDPRLLSTAFIADTTADGRDTIIVARLPVEILPVGGYGFLPARAINNTVHLNYNYITLDKGSSNGVEMDMGVISPDGVAGQVVGVSKNFSLVMSVLNKKFRTSARLLGNNNMGVLGWEGDKAGVAKLEFIPQTSTMHIGDTVETTGFSTVFPPNYMVGTVADFDKKAGDGFYTITVKLATDFRGLDNLFLVRHAYKNEIDELESEKATQ
jgi:rod shape-determining protein MreC